MHSLYAYSCSPVTQKAIARCFCPSAVFGNSGRRQPLVRAMALQRADTFKLLQYEYTPNILELRGPYREGHLKAAKAMQEQGKLVMAGAFGDPVSGGLFIFKNCEEEEIEQYAKSDPYQQNGLITGWKIMPYAVAIGN